MPRKARDERLGTRTERLKLPVRREPYWRVIQEGRAIGYRRMAGGRAGTWIARHYDAATGRTHHALGTADDLMDADGTDTLTFTQAQKAAHDWFDALGRQSGKAIAPMTVRNAVASYLDDYTARGGKALPYVRTTFNAHVLPTFGDKLVSSLTPELIRGWHHGLAAAPARLRSKPGAAQRTRAVGKAGTDERRDEQRARRATANGVLTLFKAALSHCFRDGKVASDDAWRRVRPFHKVQAARIRYLTDDEAMRLMNACQPDLRALVTAALLTGCRYQELATLRPADVDLDAGMLTIRQGKAGSPRSVVLTDEAAEFFRQAALGKPRPSLLLPRADGDAWAKSQQFRPLRGACEGAGIVPAISFHVLRHTHGSRLAMRGVPLHVIAHQLGHASVKITEKHYAHLSPGYVADTIRAAFGKLGLAANESNIVPLRPLRPLAA